MANVLMGRGAGLSYDLLAVVAIAIALLIGVWLGSVMWIAVAIVVLTLEGSGVSDVRAARSVAVHGKHSYTLESKEFAARLF